MTDVAPSEAYTAQAFLFGDTDIVSALQESGVGDIVRQEVHGFTKVTQDEAMRELGAISGELTNINLVKALVEAWSKQAELRAAGQRTASAPGSEELVELLSHRVTFDDHPSIDLLVDGHRIAELHVTMALVIDVEALTAAVRGGRLIRMRFGRCDIDASLSIEDMPVASRRAEFELPLAIPLGSGVSLVESAHPPPAA